MNGHWARTPEARQRVSARFKGARNHNWKGGVSSERDKLKASLPYKAWAFGVYLADRFTCVLCGVKCDRRNRPEAHHIKPVRGHPELALDPDNGVTLCGLCHERTYGKEQEFAAIFTVVVAKRVKSAKARPDGAEGNAEPSRDGNVPEGVETRGQAYPIVDLSHFDKRSIPCTTCGTMVVRHPYRVRTQKHHFCSNACKGVWQREAFKGKGSKRVTVSCAFCGTIVEKRPSEVVSDTSYCGQACMGRAWAQKRWHGGNAPTSALPERDDIVRAAARSAEAMDKEPWR